MSCPFHDFRRQLASCDCWIERVSHRYTRATRAHTFQTGTDTRPAYAEIGGAGARPNNPACPRGPTGPTHARATASRAQGASPRARVPPMDYRDKLPPSRYIISPPLTERISEEILYRIEIYDSFSGIAVRIPAYSKSVIIANADFFKFGTVPECLRRRLAIYGRKRRVYTACHPRHHGHRFRRRDPLL